MARPDSWNTRLRPVSCKKKGGGRPTPSAARPTAVRWPAATWCSSPNHSNPPARHPRRWWGTRRHSTRRCSVRTCRCPSRSSCSSHTSGNRRPACRWLRAKRARGPASPRQTDCSWKISLVLVQTTESITPRHDGCTRGSRWSRRALPRRLEMAGQGRERRSTQFRQTPKRIRGGRIGMPRETARYSRLTASDRGTCGRVAATALVRRTSASVPRCGGVTEAGRS